MRPFLFLMLTPLLALGDPPKLTLPPEVKGEPSFFVFVKAVTDGKQVEWVPLTPGLNVLPGGFLSDPKATAVTAAKPGKYKLLAYTGTADGPSVPAYTMVVIGNVAEPPPVDPPVPPSGSLYFLIVRPDGPAQPALTQTLALPAWGELVTKGHFYKDKTVAEAQGLGVTLPSGTVLPCVVTLRDKGTGKSEIVRGPVALPTTNDGIAKLPEGVQ